MALNISQIIAVSYPDVVNAMRKPENQWVENAFLREAERQGVIKTITGGAFIEATLDYRRNPGTEFQATDMGPVSTTKTEVLTAAQYDPVPLTVPITWSKADDAKNPAQNQKVAFVKALLENGINSHDDAIEQAIFGLNTDGFLGFQTLIPDDGLGSPGGISASTEAFWRSFSGFFDDATFADIEAQMTTAYNTCAKGSGSSLAPSLIVSDSQTQAGFEGTQQSLQRYIDSKEADAGFKILAFKTARFVFSQYATERIYFMNPKSLQIQMFKNAKRQMGEQIELPNGNAFVRKIFTMLQAVTNNKSRLGVLLPEP